MQRTTIRRDGVFLSLDEQETHSHGTIPLIHGLQMVQYVETTNVNMVYVSKTLRWPFKIGLRQSSETQVNWIDHNEVTQFVSSDELSDSIMQQYMGYT